MAPLRRTKLVLRVKDEPDPSRGGAGVLRGLDMVPTGVVGTAQELWVCLHGQLVRVWHVRLRAWGTVHRFGVGCESQWCRVGEVNRPNTEWGGIGINYVRGPSS